MNEEKSANDFNPKEIGKNKIMYCRWKIFWDIIRNLVKAGNYTSNTEIDKVNKVYDRDTSITTILIIMVRDRKRGGNPNLRF